MGVFLQKLARRLALFETPSGMLRRARFIILGADLGENIRIPPRTLCTWPHQICLGPNCVLQTDIFFNVDYSWKPGPTIIFGCRVFIGRNCEFNISNHLVVGDNCLIASGVKIIDHDHGTVLGSLVASQPVTESPIRIGNDVWIGVNAVILKGVEIGDGAIVGAGSVVNRSIPPGEIWCGVPARKVSQRTLAK
jgi:acetyltransferase-like isoleucine patch superfamily enzyme